MIPHHLLGLIGLGLASAKPVARRQEVIIPSASASGSSNGSGGGQPVPMTAVIAISVVLGTGVIALILVQIRQWRKRARLRDQSQDTTMQSLTAEDLAGTGTPRARRTAAAGSAGTTQQGTGTGTRGSRSRRRGVRRTESGRSVKTLPEYSKEAGDEELVLVRRRSGSMSDDGFDENDEAGVEAEGETVGNDSLPITIRSPSPSRSRSPPSITVGQSDVPTPAGDADIASASVTTLQNQGWGEAPTYLEAMSALDPDAPQRPQVPAPRPGALQRTASGFKELLTRPFAPGSFRSPAHPPISGPSGQNTPAGGRSRSGSTSALLHPTISRYSTASTADYPSPWASSHSLLISPPVPNSALRASFDGASMPKGGLTKEQMRFLSSNEAVNLVGIRMEDIGARKQRRRSDFSGAATPGSPRLDEDGVAEAEAPPPTWEQLDGERRMSEAFDRRNLAIPVERGIDIEEQAADLDGDQAEARPSATEIEAPSSLADNNAPSVNAPETTEPNLETDTAQPSPTVTTR